MTLRARLAGAASAAALTLALAGPAGAASPFGATVEVPLAGDADHPVAADIDRDGDLDVLVAGTQDGGQILRFRNDGRGGLTALAPLPLLHYALDVKAADLDGDGAVDLVVADSANDVELLWGDGSGGYGAPQRLAGSAGALDAIATDVDHDGRPELAIVTPTQVLVLARVGGSRTDWAVRTAPTLASPVPYYSPAHVLARDLDGDRRPELVVSGYDSLEVLRNRAGRSFARGWSERVPGGFVTSVATGDLTGDGRTDLLVTVEGEFRCEDGPCAEDPPDYDPATISRAEILAGDGAGGFTRLRTDGRNRPHRAAQIADFDGDGHLDLAYAYSMVTDDCHGLVLETWRGIGQHAPDYDCTGVGDYPFWLLSADLDGDRRADLVEGGPYYAEGFVVHLTTPLPRTVTLPARDPADDGAAGPVSAGGLTAGVAYDVTVQGTWSPWATSLFADPTGRFVTCGAADPLWRRAADAEWLFAAVARTSCAGQVLPRRGTSFQLDTGTGFTHPTPIAEDRRDHTYTYRVTGTGAPLRARLADTSTADNSGVLVISVRPASP